MTQRAVCSFFPMHSLICVSLFRPYLKLIFQANRLKLPRANCLKPSLNSRRFDQLVVFVIHTPPQNGPEMREKRGTAPFFLPSYFPVRVLKGLTAMQSLSIFSEEFY